jgi:succinate dehydrogenase / fumarate reductase flavoprotein subunit
MIVLAQAVAKGALERNECRGAHYKPELQLPIPEGKFPGDPEFEAYRARWKENNDRWLKTTVVEHREDGPQIHYQEVDTSLVPPTEPRDYR